jgi:hypothetical protein
MLPNIVEASVCTKAQIKLELQTVSWSSCASPCDAFSAKGTLPRTAKGVRGGNHVDWICKSRLSAFPIFIGVKAPSADGSGGSSRKGKLTDVGYVCQTVGPKGWGLIPTAATPEIMRIKEG